VALGLAAYFIQDGHMARIMEACGKRSYSDNLVSVVGNGPFMDLVWRAFQGLPIYGSFLCFSDNLKMTIEQLEFNPGLLDF